MNACLNVEGCFYQGRNYSSESEFRVDDCTTCQCRVNNSYYVKQHVVVKELMSLLYICRVVMLSVLQSHAQLFLVVQLKYLKGNVAQFVSVSVLLHVVHVGHDS